MRILYVAMADDYGDPSRGPSFEETNFRSALEGMGHEVVPFDFMARKAAVGRRRMNEELVSRAAESKPDVAFFCLFTDELSQGTIKKVGDVTGVPTINWFADDHWRFDDFTRYYAPAFTWSVTTDQESVPKYHAIGCRNVIRSQWACNRYAYSRVTDDLRYDVTFIGQPHGNRKQVIAALRKDGLAVECWGRGWPNGRLDHDAMVRVFSSSRVNLNLSNSLTPNMRPHARALRFLRGQKVQPRRSQIKGRTFEVPGSGGFLLTDRVPHLEDYFVLEQEVGTFESVDELAARIRWWLDHPDQRAAAADAGYQRVLAEHTYDHRFTEIFRMAGAA